MEIDCRTPGQTRIAELEDRVATLEHKLTTFLKNFSSAMTDAPHDDRKKTTRFIPPTTQQVKAYALEIGYALDAECFINSYGQKGWMVGRNKMKSWKHAVRNWKANGWGKKASTFAPLPSRR